MAETLRMFISPKMPSDTLLANDIGPKLALYAGQRVKVSHAANSAEGFS